jgi:hypothetical protein
MHISRGTPAVTRCNALSKPLLQLLFACAYSERMRSSRFLARTMADLKVAAEYVHLVILAESEFATDVERPN